MNNPIFVCPFNETLISKLNGKALVIRTEDYESIPHIHRFVDHHNKLHCVWIMDKKKFLSAISFRDEWKNTPISLFLAGLGSFKTFLTQLPLLRQSNIRIFFPTDNERALTDLQIMASLNVDCGFFFSAKAVNWDAVNDLMIYAVYSRAHHASIEPVDFVISRYNPQSPVDFNSVYFDNPHRYLHIDEEENIALTHSDLLNGNFISRGIETLDHIEENPAVIESQTRWQDFFLQPDGCAYCPAWRICLGKFASSCPNDPGCKTFFSDLLDAADDVRETRQKKGGKELCRL